MTDTNAVPGDNPMALEAKIPAPPRKSDLVNKLLRRAKGATVAELQQATDWKPHSIRAFLSGLRKKGTVLTKEQRKGGETAYRSTATKEVVGATDVA